MIDDANPDRMPLDRRGLLGAIALLGAAAAPGPKVHAEPVAAGAAQLNFRGGVLNVVDLTHELTPEFNMSPTRTRISMQAIEGSGAAVGMNLNLLYLVEHTGTHIDAPRHFADDGASLGQIPVGDLVVPLVVLDVREKAAKERNAEVTPDDIRSWEARNGRLPNGCCVAMRADWDPLAERRRGAGLTADAARKSPGFGVEATQMLIAERNVKGMAVEAMSIDTGTNGPAYPVHQAWLRSGRWGIEGITNLVRVPERGALLVVGAAPVRDATGMPIRALALF